MSSYILVVIADILLTVTLVLQKQYQSKAGTSVKASLVYTILSGVFSAGLFFAINGFKVRVTLFSIFLAVLFSILLTTYVFIGFRIIKNGNLSLYTLFLMSGGMVVPYMYGVLFLKEELNIARIIGIILIIAAIILFNYSKKNNDRKQLILCVGVFLLNGMVSVISKTHQISAASKIVSSSDFVFLVAVSKVIISLLVLPFCKENRASESTMHIKSVILIVFIAAAADGMSYMLQLIGAVNLPATVLYPLITGGTIVLSALVDFVIYRQKLSPGKYIGVATAFLGTLLFL